MQLLSEVGFYDDLYAELEGAREVTVCTFQYDHPELHARLLRGLRGGLSLLLCVDKQGVSTCRGMRSRLLDLKRAGADVRACQGHGHQGVYGAGGAGLTGHMHKKVVVIDRRVGYLGGQNLTRSSLTNEENTFKVKGPVVAELLASALDTSTRGEAFS